MPWIRPCDGRIWPAKHKSINYYLRCLDLEEMVPLSKASWLVPHHASENISNVVIFCVWRMPNGRKDEQCFQCNGWYHPTCVSIPDWMIKSNRRWKYDTCRGKKVERYHLHKSATTLKLPLQTLPWPLKDNCMPVYTTFTLLFPQMATGH